MSKKNLYQALRDAADSIDETLPEIRGIWRGVREAVWAYVRFTAIGAVLIIGAGAWLGVYATLNPAHAATYDIVGDMTAGAQRMCGRADPVLDPDPGHVPGEPGAAYIWLERWRVTTCDGHNPALSCPPGLVQWHHMLGAGGEDPSYRDYVCYDLSVPPQPLDQPRIRPCYDADGQPCFGQIERWPAAHGAWYGTWWPALVDFPGACPTGSTLKDVSGGQPPGVRRLTCVAPAEPN